MNTIDFQEFAQKYVANFGMDFSDFSALKKINFAWIEHNLTKKRKKRLYPLLKKFNLDEKSTYLLVGCIWAWLSRNLYLVNQDKGLSESERKKLVFVFNYLIDII